MSEWPDTIKSSGPKAPEGFIFTGELRLPKKGEYYLGNRLGSVHLSVMRAKFNHSDPNNLDTRKFWIMTPEPCPFMAIQEEEEMKDRYTVDSLLPEGYEWVRGSVGDAITQDGFYAYHNTTGECYIAKPKVKVYDWSKTGLSVLVVDSDGETRPKDETVGRPSRLSTDSWQAHIEGNPCPVDDECTIVHIYGEDTPCVAKEVDWSYTHIFKVAGLVDNCKYP